MCHLSCISSSSKAKALSTHFLSGEPDLVRTSRCDVPAGEAADGIAPDPAHRGFSPFFLPGEARILKRSGVHAASPSDLNEVYKKSPSARDPEPVAALCQRRRRSQTDAKANEAAFGARDSCPATIRTYFVEKAKMVVLSNFPPGRRIVEGKFGWWMESGKCWVSRQNRPCLPV